MIFIVLFYLFFPETKNKTLEELEAIFGDRVAETLEEAGKHLGELVEEEYDSGNEKTTACRVREGGDRDEQKKEEEL